MRSTPSPNEATWKRLPAGTSWSQPTISRSASYWSGVRPSQFCMMMVHLLVTAFNWNGRPEAARRALIDAAG